VRFGCRVELVLVLVLELVAVREPTARLVVRRRTEGDEP
jgi:hypothetical protein